MSRAPLLLTPGPLSTALETRRAMERDWGSRDPEFVACISRVCSALAKLVSEEGYVAVPLQGSGTFAVEAMLGTFVPRQGKLLVLVNGAYGHRMVALAQRMGRAVDSLVWHESEVVDVRRLDAALSADAAITHVAVVYCETTTGLLNPIEAVGKIVETHGRSLLIDAMSALGALPLRASQMRFDAVAGSANKCLEGVPGLAFVVARRDALDRCEGQCHSVSLDLHAQAARLARDGQFRFTPPTHVLAALDRSLALHEAEGGVEGRGRRYRANCEVLVAGLSRLGLRTLLPPETQAPIIVTVLAPSDPAWDFALMYAALNERGYSIYPGKLTERETFRVGCIGQVFPADMRAFVDALGEVLDAQGVYQREPKEEQERT